MKILIANKIPSRVARCNAKPIQSINLKKNGIKSGVNPLKNYQKTKKSLKNNLIYMSREENIVKNAIQSSKERTINEKEQKTPISINVSMKSNEKEKNQRELELWRAKKGRSLKENCHPLLSRKRPLCKIVSSPSYKPSALNYKLGGNTKEKIYNRRHTMIINKEESLTIQRPDRRKTISSNLMTKNTKTPQKISSTIAENTPWQNKRLTMRQRLDLWMEAKGKTPGKTPSKMFNATIKAPPRNSPHPRKQTISSPVQTSLKTTEDLNATFTIEDPTIESSLEDKLTGLLQKLEKSLDVEEIQSDLDKVIKAFPDAVHQADYWICKARLAAKENDVRRVVCLLEQAYTFDAKPEEKIKEEIVNFLNKLEEQNKEDNNDEEEDYFNKYAITPGRRVHFAVDTMSPSQFQSSIIRFCIIESKSFKKRLNAQIRRKIMTPVRRSVRLQKADLPAFLRSNIEFINSPSQVERDILDGELGFQPNTAINTPLNNGWILRDEENKHDIRNALHEEKTGINLSFI